MVFYNATTPFDFMKVVQQSYQAFDRLRKDLAYFKKNEPTFEVMQGALPSQCGGPGNAIMLRGKIDGIDMAFYVPYDYPERYPLCVIYNPQVLDSRLAGMVENMAINGMEWVRVHTILTKVSYVRDYVRKVTKTKSSNALYTRGAGLQLTALQDMESLSSNFAAGDKLDLTDFYPKAPNFTELYESITQKDKAEESVPSTPSPATRPYPYPLYTSAYNEQTPKSYAFPTQPFIALNVKFATQEASTSRSVFSYYLRRCRHIVSASEALIEKQWQYNRNLYHENKNQAESMAGEISAMLGARRYRITAVLAGSNLSGVLTSIYENNHSVYEHSSACATLQTTDLLLKRIMYSNSDMGEIQQLLNIDDLEVRISYLAG